MDKKYVQLEENFLYHHALWLKEQDSLFDFASFTKVIKKAQNESDFFGYVSEVGQKEFNYILTYFGVRNFYLNLSKFLIKNVLDEFVLSLKDSLKEIAAGEEEFSRSYFCRYFCQDEEHPALVLDWILTFEYIFSFLFSMEKDRVFTQRKNYGDLYKTLGFSKKENFSIYREEKYKENLDLMLFMLVSKLVTIRKILKKEDDSILEVEAGLTKFQKLSLKDQSDPVGYIQKIVSYLKEFFNSYKDFLSSFKSKLELLHKSLDSSVRSKILIDQDTIDEISLSIGTADLLQSKKASEDLGEYMNKHELQPDEMIDAELSGINPLLNKKALNIVKSQLKMKKMSKANYFINSVGKVKKFLISGLLFAFILVGCGVKTAPRSDIIESRPDIPFGEQK